jgi:hypothetical protein
VCLEQSVELLERLRVSLELLPLHQVLYVRLGLERSKLKMAMRVLV